MKRNSLLISFLSLLLFLGSCNSGAVLTPATGLAYEVVVVMSPKDWQSPGGLALKSELTSAIPGLPQAEAALRVTYSSPNDFNGLLTYVKNILIVKINPSLYTKVSIGYEHDVYSNGQVIAYLKAPSADKIKEFITEHPGVIVNFFEGVERDRFVQQLDKNYSTVVYDHLMKDFGIKLRVPANMTYYKDTTNFFWASNNANTGRTDIVVYSFPYTDRNTFTADYLVAKRDSFMRLNLPGAFPDSYMETEKRFGVEYKAISVNGQYCGELRGLWRVKNDMMGGPFVQHIRLDQEHKRVIVAEGFVFAPETQKRNFIRRIEAALYTLRMPGEVDIASSSSLSKEK